MASCFRICEPSSTRTTCSIRQGPIRPLPRKPKMACHLWSLLDGIADCYKTHPMKPRAPRIEPSSSIRDLDISPDEKRRYKHPPGTRSSPLQVSQMCHAYCFQKLLSLRNAELPEQPEGAQGVPALGAQYAKQISFAQRFKRVPENFFRIITACPFVRSFRNPQHLLYQLPAS